jgi:hypothetical protein
MASDGAIGIADGFKPYSQIEVRLRIAGRHSHGFPIQLACLAQPAFLLGPVAFGDQALGRRTRRGCGAGL